MKLIRKDCARPRRQGRGWGRTQIKHGTIIAEALKGIIAPRLSLLLYLCSVNIADGKGSDRKPANPQPTKVKSAKKLFAAATPTDWNVGVRIGAAIRAAQARERANTQRHASARKPFTPSGHLTFFKFAEVVRLGRA